MSVFHIAMAMYGMKCVVLVGFLSLYGVWYMVAIASVWAVEKVEKVFNLC